jgi:hypothetical protein
MLRLYSWGYLNQVRSSRTLDERARDLEALWLMRFEPRHGTIGFFLPGRTEGFWVRV